MKAEPQVAAPGRDRDGARDVIEAALDALPYGFVLFDSQHRLVRWNSHFVALRGLDPARLRSGMSIDDLALLSIEAGNHPPEAVEAYLRRVASRSFFVDSEIQEDLQMRGRVIRRTRRPLGGAGWLITYVDVTQDVELIERLTRSEAEIKLQHSRLEGAFANIPNGLAMYDSGNRLVAWNRQFADIFGVPFEALKQGMTLRQFLDLRYDHIQDPDQNREAFIEERAGRITASPSARYQVSLPGGRTIQVTRDPTPEGGTIGTHRDITEELARIEALKRSEEALKLQHGQLEAAFASIPHGLALYDAENRLVVWNRRFCEIFGVPFDLVTPGMALRRFMELRYEHNPPAGQSREAFVEERVRAVTAAPSARYHAALPGGRVALVTRDPMPDGGWIATHQDITEDLARIEKLRRSEEELELQHSRLHATLNNIPHGIAMYDREGRLVVWNRRLCDMFGVPADKLKTGMTLRQFIELRLEHSPPIDEPREEYIRRRVEMGTDPSMSTYEFDLPDGRIIWVTRDPTPEGGWVATHMDVTDERRSQQRIRHLARHDPLTDLPNRTVLREEVEAAGARMRRGMPMAMVCIDLDRFKAVNDTLGHAAGDDVLKAVADRLRCVTREGDVVARLGGDEFAVFMTSLDQPRDAAVLAERLIRALSGPIETGGHRAFIGASIGIAVAPEDGRDFDTLMKNGDLALYRAKAQGRGTFHFFEPSMDEALQERRLIEAGLRLALERGEFSLVYQPVFHLEENRISAFEALLRWNHPERGVITPDRFISIAEESGLICPIGEWVLNEACAAAAGWPDDVSIAVNLSPAQFKSRDLVDEVRQALARAGIAARRLELEVTESLLLQEGETTLAVLHDLRAVGARISMDDFGTGYSSLSYLRSFPFDKIKIDRSFVRDLTSARDSRAIVNAVIGLGRSLGMRTTAEGVETAAQLDVVREEGCTEVQGFLLSPPLPIGAATELLVRSGRRMPASATHGKRSV